MTSIRKWVIVIAEPGDDAPEPRGTVYGVVGPFPSDAACRDYIKRWEDSFSAFSVETRPAKDGDRPSPPIPEGDRPVDMRRAFEIARQLMYEEEEARRAGS